jgi:hypothetical protein
VSIEFEELRPAVQRHVATGSLACPRCDAPVHLARPTRPAARLGCPFCDHAAPLRDFLSLGEPTRPARVRVRISPRGQSGRTSTAAG